MDGVTDGVPDTDGVGAGDADGISLVMNVKGAEACTVTWVEMSEASVGAFSAVMTSERRLGPCRSINQANNKPTRTQETTTKRRQRARLKTWALPKSHWSPCNHLAVRCAGRCGTGRLPHVTSAHQTLLPHPHSARP
jgi:hypothetical protein